MTSLQTSDLHLDQNPRNKYRWEILPWLEAEGLKRGVDYISVLGDLTDAKDKHPASLVNKLADFFAGSKNRWVILKGNHDFSDPNCPFFGFLGYMKNLMWITGPGEHAMPVDDDNRKCLFLPATSNHEIDWKPYLKGGFDYIFMHGTIAGTKSETGFELPGLPTSFFDKTKFYQLYAGDVHVPGPIGDRDGMESVGAPYRVHFGDTYKPRVIHIGKENPVNLYPPIISRHTIEIRRVQDLDNFSEIKSEDQVKLRVRLRRSEFPEWRKIRSEILAEANRLEWEICGVELLEQPSVRRRLEDGPEPQPERAYKTPEEHLRFYAEGKKLKDKEIEFGLGLLKQ